MMAAAGRSGIVGALQQLDNSAAPFEPVLGRLRLVVTLRTKHSASKPPVKLKQALHVLTDLDTRLENPTGGL